MARDPKDIIGVERPRWAAAVVMLAVMVAVALWIVLVADAGDSACTHGESSLGPVTVTAASSPAPHATGCVP